MDNNNDTKRIEHENSGRAGDRKASNPKERSREARDK